MSVMVLQVDAILSIGDGLDSQVIGRTSGRLYRRK